MPTQLSKMLTSALVSAAVLALSSTAKAQDDSKTGPSGLSLTAQLRMAYR